jgi:Domain of unknown function (DUF1992)
MSQERMTRQTIQRVAENRIREAMENGEFDDLPGLGKPIPGIDEPYDPTGGSNSGSAGRSSPRCWRRSSTARRRGRDTPYRR